MAGATISAVQISGFILNALTQAHVPMDDQTLAVAQAARQFLRAIADGSLTVNATAPQQASGIVPAGTVSGVPPINGADGVIPETVSGAPQT